jgi:hypothetical protein
MRRALYVVLLLIQISAFSQDLIVTNYSGSTTFSRYEEFLADITVKNSGILPVTYFYSAAFLSTDDQWQSSDMAIQGFSTSNLGVDASSTSHLKGLRIEALPGTYFLIIKVDVMSGVTETDETNNLLIIPNVVVSPADVDFTFVSFSLDKSTYTQNDLMKPSYVLQNLGTTPAGGAIQIKFVLSTDVTWSQDDKYLDTDAVTLTKPEDFTSGPDLSTPLPTVPNGNYYVLACADASKSIEESNEDNNVFAVPVSIQSSNVDLVITAVHNLSLDGGLMSADISVRNSGTTGVAGCTIGTQLVRQGYPPDPYSYKSGFAWLGDFDGYLAPGEVRTLYLHFNIDQPSAGTYYPVFEINYDRFATETSFSNNTYIDYSYPIIVQPPPTPAVTFNNVTILGAVDDTDQQINLNLNLTNSGETVSFPQYYDVVVKNAQNSIVHSQQSTVWISFSPSQTSSQPVTLNLSAPLQRGTYQVSVSCSSSCYTTPSSKNTSLTVTPTEYTLTGVVNGEDGQPITNGKLFLYQDDGSGNIRFIQKIVPYTGPSFSFPIDTNPHTLYFIPDPVQYPDYVPTIYGKTVALQESNFFTASANMNVTFEILKVNSPGIGTGIINGSVSAADPPSGVMQQQSIQSIADLPVILISNTGQIVGVTYTDESGSYQFKNLPRDIYQVMVSLELDNPSIMEPFTVDITEKNMNVDLVVKSDGAQPAASQFFLPQLITFSEFATYQYGDPSITPYAQSDKGLPIEYISSDTSIANVINNEIIIKDVGTVVITARQGGNNFYLPASVNRTLTITKANQTLTLSSLPVKKFGDGPFVVSSASSVGLTPTLSTSNAAIASVSGTTITIHGAGTVEIIAEQPGNSHYNAASTVREWLTIEKAPQTITFEELPEQDIEIGSFVLSATATSGLDVSFESSDEEIVSIVGNVAYVHKGGTVNITARQSGNQNYHAAGEIVRTQVVNVILGIEVVGLSSQVFPNPTTGVLFFQIPGLNNVEVYDALGRIRREAVWMNDKVDFSRTEPGVYFVKFFLKNQSVTARIIKQ